ncbi:hypothetical protein [Caballeronia sordidicola]|uniref:hypothetical protein n=1 Tax=Caballeronia sordidicola TaxID=196367 RepID=UPI001178A3D3|nr:hypothetical protein [Caballeronia sordidicola]
MAMLPFWMDDVLQDDAGRNPALAFAEWLTCFGASLWQKALQMPYGFVPIQHENLRSRVDAWKRKNGHRCTTIKVVSLCFTMTAIDCCRLTISPVLAAGCPHAMPRCSVATLRFSKCCRPACSNR